MSLIRDFINKLRFRRAHPVIDSPYGTVTESARHQAAMNMKNDPALRRQVEDLIQRQTGLGREAAVIETKRRYPEAYAKGE